MVPKNNIRIPRGHFHSKTLNPVARRIVDLAFAMGGSPGRYFNSVKCNYIFPNGESCFNQERSDHSIDCPLCKGNGAYYEDPVEIPIIISDSTNPLSGDKYGATFDDRVSLTLPVYVDPSIIKVSKSGQLHVVKDKFALYDHQSKLWAIFIMSSEPFEPYLAGPLFRVVEVTSQYTQRQDDSYDEPKIYYNVAERDLLQEINKDILTINDGELEEYPDIDHTNVLVTNEPNITVIDDITELEDDWS